MVYKKLLKKSFTLIELIVVIVILGILAAIVIPNVSSFKEEASLTATQSNVRNLQTSVDMYSLDFNGTYPTYSKPEAGIPQPIDFTKIKPEYVRDLPKDKSLKYWVDYQGKVWASTVDSPTGVINDGTNLTWIDSGGAVAYNIYEVTAEVTGAVSKSKISLSFVKKVEGTTSFATGDSKKYAVSSLDEQGFETPPAVSGYKGYDEYIILNPESTQGSNPAGNTGSDGQDGSEEPTESEEQPVPETPAAPTVEEVYGGKYLVLDIEGSWGYDTYTTISEIVIYDMEGKKIPYQPASAYDTVSKGTPYYWNTVEWSKTNLNDNNIYYVDNLSGNQSTFVLGRENLPYGDQLWGRISLELLSEQQIGKVVVYAGSPEKRIPKAISIYTADQLDVTKNLTQRNNEGLSFMQKFTFDGTELSVKPYEAKNPNFIDTPSSQVGNLSMTTRYLIFEVAGKYPSGDQTYSTLTEIEIFDVNGNKIAYTPTDRYDAALGQNYWTSNVWNKTNLNDGDIGYVSNITGGQAATVFHGINTSESNTWARFTVDLGSIKEVGSIKVWAGSPEKRNPRTVSVFKAENYNYTEHLPKRTNIGLEPFGSVAIPETQYTIKDFTIQ